MPSAWRDPAVQTRLARRSSLIVRPPHRQVHETCALPEDRHLATSLETPLATRVQIASKPLTAFYAKLPYARVAQECRKGRLHQQGEVNKRRLARARRMGGTSFLELEPLDVYQARRDVQR